jgi:DNA-directed RNA polymerase specialized sigma54-like protein
MGIPMSPERRLAHRLLEASCSQVGRIIREELGDTNLFSAKLLETIDWDGPDIRVHGPRGGYTVEICDEPFAVLNVEIDDAPFDTSGNTVAMLPVKVRTVVKGLRMRQQALRRVAEGFLSLQYALPHRPNDRFKPVSVRQIADRAALHESTVKRAVANKVITIGSERIPFDSLVTSVEPRP